jgi:cytochrome P450
MANFMLNLIYGYTPAPNGQDFLIKLVETFMRQFSIATVPGAWLVDMLPWLQYLPEWLPGTSFKKTARHIRKTYNNAIEIPYGFTERQTKSGTMKPSIVSSLLKEEPDERQRYHIKGAANILYLGGTDTTAASLSWFFLAISVFPEVQEKARDEIDRVVGPYRLPGFEDRERLPYINATVKEVLRWYPITPLGLPHVADEDDEYRGYIIPKAAIVIPVVAQFMRDPKTYRDPDQFRPERFLGPNPEPNPTEHVFGYGRRICPGRHIADANLYLTIAQSLAALDVKKEVDKVTGEVLEPKIHMLPGVIGHPKPYHCRITPRNDKYAELIQSVEIEHPWEEGDAHLLRGLD